MTTRIRRALAAVLGLVLTAVAWTPAQAAEPGRVDGSPLTAAAAPPDFSFQIGDVVLDPSDRGYHGSLPVTIRYRGAEPANLSVTILEPVPSAFDRIPVRSGCSHWALQARRLLTCDLWDAFQPGELRSVRPLFEVLTKARNYPMSAAGGLALVHRTVPGGGPIDPALIDDGVPFSTVFRATTGSVRHPEPYVWDTASDVSIRIDDVHLALQPDGSYSAWTAFTIHWAGDAPHEPAEGFFATLPEGVRIAATNPPAWCPGGSGCQMPFNTEFMEDEDRLFHIQVTAPAGTAPGVLGEAVVTLFPIRWNGVPLVDLDPADNSTSFTVTVG